MGEDSDAQHQVAALRQRLDLMDENRETEHQRRTRQRWRSDVRDIAATVTTVATAVVTVAAALLAATKII